MDEVARTTADAAMRLLNGSSPGSITLPPQVSGRPVFDGRELERWGIPEARLPRGSVVRYQRPSLWHEYRATALSAVGVLLSLIHISEPTRLLSISYAVF